MNPDWKNPFDVSADNSGTPPQPPFVALLQGPGLLRLRGADAVNFLQGQVTNDVTRLTLDQAHYTAHCSAKGRVIALGPILRHQDDLLWQLPREQLPALLQRLRMFVLRAKVELDDVSDDWLQLGLWGDGIDGALGQAGIRDLPEDFHQVRELGAAELLLRTGIGSPRYLWLGDRQAAQRLHERLRQIHPVAEHHWRLQDIEQGLPQLGNATSEAFVPQMLNLEALAGVSYTKGCYTGQEVVARMHYLGKLKRRMYRAQVSCEQPPRPGQELTAPGSKSGQGAGKIVSCEAQDDGSYRLLAVIETDALERGPVLIPDSQAELVLQPLPYSVEPQNQEENA